MRQFKKNLVSSLPVFQLDSRLCCRLGSKTQREQPLTMALLSLDNDPFEKHLIQNYSNNNNSNNKSDFSLFVGTDMMSFS